VNIIKNPYRIIDFYYNRTQRKQCDSTEYDQENVINTISDLLSIDKIDIYEYYAETLIIQEDIKNKIENLARMGTMDMDAIILYILIRGIKANKIVETGVANGASTYYILSAIKKNGGKGHLYSIDMPYHEIIDQKDILRRIGISSKDETRFGGVIPIGKKIGWLVPEKLRVYWSLFLGDSKKILPKLLSDLGNIDIFNHDSHHSYRHMSFEYSVNWNHLSEGGLLCSHDILQNYAFDDFVKKNDINRYIKIGNFGCCIHA